MLYAVLGAARPVRERDVMRERTVAGLQAARALAGIISRPQADAAHARANPRGGGDALDRAESPAKIARVFGCSRSTVYRAVAALPGPRKTPPLRRGARRHRIGAAGGVDFFVSTHASILSAKNVSRLSLGALSSSVPRFALLKRLLHGRVAKRCKGGTPTSRTRSAPKPDDSAHQKRAARPQLLLPESVRVGVIFSRLGCNKEPCLSASQTHP